MITAKVATSNPELSKLESPLVVSAPDLVAVEINNGKKQIRIDVEIDGLVFSALTTANLFVRTPYKCTAVIERKNFDFDPGRYGDVVIADSTDISIPFWSPKLINTDYKKWVQYKGKTYLIVGVCYEASVWTWKDIQAITKPERFNMVADDLRRMYGPTLSSQHIAFSRHHYHLLGKLEDIWPVEVITQYMPYYEYKEEKNGEDFLRKNFQAWFREIQELYLLECQ